jgi:hypothetical protein
VVVPEADSSRWESSLKTLRKTQTGIGWVFQEAGRVLDAPESPMTTRNKELLKGMIKAMTDQKEPLPHFPS